MDSKITIFTPTYNRAHTLPALYESLVNQTCKDFIWLVIDDGSADSTKDLVEGWVNEKKVKIKYVIKQNGGKHTTIELSNELCETPYIVCIDSDDLATNDAVKIFYSYLDKVNADDIVGIVFPKHCFDGTPMSGNFPVEEQLLYFHELAAKYNYIQETALLFKTDIIKNFHFPIFAGEKFVTESVFYNKFMLDYKMLAANKKVYLCEYLQDGYTNQGIKLFVNNPYGYLYALKQDTYFAKKKRSGLKTRLALAAYYHAWARLMKLDKSKISGYKLNWLHSFAGYLLSPIVYRSLKKKIKYLQADC